MEAFPLSDEYHEVLKHRDRRDDEPDDDAPQTDEEIAEAVGVSVEAVRLVYSVEPFVEYAPDDLSQSTIEFLVDAFDLDGDLSNEAVAESVGVSEATVQMFRSFDTYCKFWPDSLNLSKVHYGTLLLWKTTDLPHEEIADAIEVSPHTVHKYLTRRYSKYEGALEDIKRAETTAEFLLAIDSSIPDHLDD